MPRTKHPSSAKACQTELSNSARLVLPKRWKDDKDVKARNTAQENGRWVVSGLGAVGMPYYALYPVVSNRREDRQMKWPSVVGFYPSWFVDL